jgi:hypothetical protein
VVVEIMTITPDYQRQPAGTPYRLATARYPSGEVKEARIYMNQEYAIVDEIPEFQVNVLSL